LQEFAILAQKDAHASRCYLPSRWTGWCWPHLYGHARKGLGYESEDWAIRRALMQPILPTARLWFRLPQEHVVRGVQCWKTNGPVSTLKPCLKVRARRLKIWSSSSQPLDSTTSKTRRLPAAPFPKTLELCENPW